MKYYRKCHYPRFLNRKGGFYDQEKINRNGTQIIRLLAIKYETSRSMHCEIATKTLEMKRDVTNEFF